MRAALIAISAAIVFCLSAQPVPAQLPLNTTVNNFHLRGTQPNSLTTNLATSSSCSGCHSNSATIYNDWSGSLMSHAARDPLFYACLDIAESDAPGSGDMCIRCHVPKAWLEGRSSPTSGSAITANDRDSINCAFCHRLIDPFNTMGDAPPEDAAVLASLGADAPQMSMDRGMPSSPGLNGNGGYVVDPPDRRRGPFPLPPDAETPPEYPEADCLVYHDPTPTFESPFHTRADICSTCHDVSNPHFKYNAGGTALIFNGTGVQHPTGNKYDMGPVERTFSEWMRSDFAQGIGVDMGGRFGGPGQNYVSICQDCHMPVNNLKGCTFVSDPRPDIPQHFFSGASTWQLDAIAQKYGPGGTNEINATRVTQMTANKSRNIAMLQNAADLAASLDDSQSPGIKKLKIRVTNQTGHKLPSGYPEGRRMWLTVQYFSCNDLVNPILTDGGYDNSTAVLDTATTKVYEIQGGLDSDLAAMLNRPAGPASHFVLTNAVFKDNRIPPRGFTNTKFAAIQAAPVAYSYSDGQYWDDTFFDIPAYAFGAKVTLYYQATSKEYIEFLRDNNPNPGNPNNAGLAAYNLWVSNGKSAPVAMATLGSPSLIDVDLKGDLNGDRQVNLSDIPGFVQVLLGQTADPKLLCAADTNRSGVTNGADIQSFVQLLIAP
ncbi:MAG TPA: dockerin type I domain-containing protein [Phycisphaerae bacterium]|nr:dockerin type I domain-containing protein [Phycisphaerae bacterium]